MKPMKDIAGQRFGRLVAVEYVGNSRWKCRCDCGGTAICLTNNLTRGNSTSCGCVQVERRFTHGMSGDPMYRVWIGMKSRCDTPSDGQYHNYGGRGIKVCDRWSESFEAFLLDMGRRPKGYDIDRRDNDKGYEPGNCRWVTRRKNLSNRRANHRIEWRGISQTIAEWAETLGINEETLRHRINRGWPVDRAMTDPVHRVNPSSYALRDRSSRKSG